MECLDCCWLKFVKLLVTALRPQHWLLEIFHFNHSYHRSVLNCLLMVYLWNYFHCVVLSHRVTLFLTLVNVLKLLHFYFIYVLCKCFTWCLCPYSSCNYPIVTVFVIAFACMCTICWFNSSLGRTFNACALVGIIATSTNVVKGLQSAHLSSCLTFLHTKYWLFSN